MITAFPLLDRLLFMIFKMWFLILDTLINCTSTNQFNLFGEYLVLSLAVYFSLKKSYTTRNLTCFLISSNKLIQNKDTIFRLLMCCLVLQRKTVHVRWNRVHRSFSCRKLTTILECTNGESKPWFVTLYSLGESWGNCVDFDLAVIIKLNWRLAAMWMNECSVWTRTFLWQGWNLFWSVSFSDSSECLLCMFIALS